MAGKLSIGGDPTGAKVVFTFALRKLPPMPSDTIALIDDDAAVLDSLRMVLANRGMQAECFSSAEAFLAHAGPPLACIVSDVRMPGLSGLELRTSCACAPSGRR